MSINTERNKYLADLSEIQTIFSLAQYSKYTNKEVIHDIDYLQTKWSIGFNKIDNLDEVSRQSLNGNRIASAVNHWTKESSKYTGAGIEKMWWVASPIQLAAVTDVKLNPLTNPSDVLIRYDSGDYLGVSIKTSRGGGNVGFKNPGLGTISAALKIPAIKYYQETQQYMIEKYNMPTSAKERKKFIRTNPVIQSETQKVGSTMLREIRGMMMESLTKMNNEEIRNHISDIWMNNNEKYDVRYIKVTATRDNVVIDDPFNCAKKEALDKYDIEFEEVGNETINVTAGNVNIMAMRLKFESEKLASSIKLSGDSR